MKNVRVTKEEEVHQEKYIFIEEHECDIHTDFVKTKWGLGDDISVKETSDRDLLFLLCTYFYIQEEENFLMKGKEICSRCEIFALQNTIKMHCFKVCFSKSNLISVLEVPSQRFLLKIPTTHF